MADSCDVGDRVKKNYCPSKKARRKCYVKNSEDRATPVVQEVIQEEAITCVVCKELLSKHLKSVCGRDNHLVCFKCFQNLSAVTCPLCRNPEDLSWNNTDDVARQIDKKNDEVMSDMSYRIARKGYTTNTSQHLKNVKQTQEWSIQRTLQPLLIQHMKHIIFKFAHTHQNIDLQMISAML
jgi:hypothetical protein